MNRIRMAVVAALSLSALIASSPSEAARRDARQGLQRKRIQQGKKSGELTRREARKLRHEEGRIRRAEKRAEADGEVTGKEKAHIEKMQDRASRDIHRMKHNGKEAHQPGELGGTPSQPTTPAVPAVPTTPSNPGAGQ